jgi:hypothetical protein
MLKNFLFSLSIMALIGLNACKNSGDDNPEPTNPTTDGVKPVFNADAVWINGFAPGHITLNQKTGKNMVTDAQGNIYVLATFTGSVDADPGTGTVTLTATGSSSLLLAKYSKAGQYIWAKSIPIDQKDNTPSLTLDPGGNVYVASSLTGSVQITTGVTLNAGNYKLIDRLYPATVALVAKYDGNGNFVSAVRYPNNDAVPSNTSSNAGGSAVLHDVAADASGNVYIGYIIPQDKGDVGEVNHHHVAKINSSGTRLWDYSFNGEASGKFQSDVNNITLDKDNNIIASGYFFGYARYPYHYPPNPLFLLDSPIPTSFGANFIGKINTESGKYVWVKTLMYSSTSNINIVHGLTTSADGSIYLSGYRDKDAASSGGVNTSLQHIVYKFGTTGDELWRKTINAQTTSGRSSVVVHASGDVIISGTYNTEVVIGGTSPLTGTAKNNVYIVKFRADGSYVSSQNITGKIDNDQVSSYFLNADNSNHINMLGYYASGTASNSVYLTQLNDK